MNEFTRNCPECNKILNYKYKSSFKKAERRSSLCRKCTNNQEHVGFKKGKDNPFYGKGYLQVGEKNHMYGRRYNHTQGTKDKISKTKMWHEVTDETKRKLSETFKRMGYKPPLTFGRIPWNKGLTKETDDRMAEMVEKKKGQKRSDEAKQNMRKSRVEYIKKIFKVNCPNYSINACRLFKKINEEFGLNGIYAESGGEYYLSDLGYWLDYYDEERNIVIEYYDRGHYRGDKSLTEKTLKREKEIIERLDCVFIRVNAFDEKDLKFEIIK